MTRLHGTWQVTGGGGGGPLIGAVLIAGAVAGVIADLAESAAAIIGAIAGFLAAAMSAWSVYLVRRYRRNRWKPPSWQAITPVTALLPRALEDRPAHPAIGSGVTINVYGPIGAGELARVIEAQRGQLAIEPGDEEGSGACS